MSTARPPEGAQHRSPQDGGFQYTSHVDDNQAMLAESARKYVERGYTGEIRAASLASPHGCAPERWRELADMGWLALPLPEADGGLGGSLADICVLAEELGQALVVEPWIASSVLAASLLSVAGTPAQRAQWLPALAAGDKRIAFAAWEPGSRFDATRIQMRAERGEGYRLSGDKELAWGAPGADALIVAALREGAHGTEPALFLVDPAAAGVEMRGYTMIDGRHAAHLRLDKVVLKPEALLDAGTDIAQHISDALDRAMLVSCAETVGAMAKALDITLDYLKTRKQFGRVVASNQALQHRLVDMHVAIEECRVLVRAAAAALDASDAPALEREAMTAAAKAYTSQAARLLWEETVQMHGAIGMTHEYVLGGYVRYLAASHTLFGDAPSHLERLAAVEDRMHALN